MTVLEWLKASTRYTFEEETFRKIAYDRGCEPEDDVYGGGVTERQRQLMIADIIFTAVLLSPSSTSSLQQAHNGYQKTIGAETDYYQDDKITYAIKIYKLYEDEKADILESVKKKIYFIPIEDVTHL
jgi:phage terminase large subunit-like protein